MSPILPEACHRTRQQLSLRLDTDVSELEEALLAAHLAKCAACSAFADDVQALTTTLRTAPLVEPPGQFQLPRRRARVGVAHVGTAAAAMVTVAIALGGFASLGSSQARISAADVESAHERMFLKEQLMEDTDTTAVRPARRVPRGVAAAKNATVSSTQGAR